MSTPEEPTPPLTRRRLRELKMTGQNPVITPEEAEAANAAREAEGVDAVTQEAPPAPETDAADVESEAAAEAEPDVDFEAEPEETEGDPEGHRGDATPEAGPEEHAAEDDGSAESVDDADAFGRPLTRRQVRERERLRTNQLSIVQSDDAPADEAPAEEAVAVAENETSVVYEVVEAEPSDHAEDAEETASEDATVHELVFEPVVEPVAGSEGETLAERAEEELSDAPVETVYVEDDAVADEEPEERPTVAPTFGSTVLRAEPERSSQPGSFEEILSQAADSSGTATAASTLILQADPGTIPLSAPIDATGEILLTSTHALPEGFGSRGHAAGTTDGKEVDVVLLDGELPLSSSPTPIAASDAVSTSKSPSEVIRPPAPEKTHRLTLILGITAGALGIALIGVVVAAFTTGVLG
ncbi:hypothetical protein [Microbacterium marinilacus]|uniref:Uncharacterized protein n=1 Tax=Microbacterium marinilacus TaxID=415209 RepID=A0ABP7B210_9MICO|nr:hypothetical protein [Microbacterium marinilacus]MBY0688569.1 hypothetical protein [Microbacterium marinilacus]